MTKTMRIGQRASLTLSACALVAGCAGTASSPWGQAPVPIETRSPQASPQPASPSPQPTPPPTAPPAGRPEHQGRELALTLLPPAVTKDRSGWAADILAAFSALRLAPSPENFCAAIAVIEQESGFQADPEVPGLSRIAWREIETRRKRHHIPKLALDAALAKSSPDGRTYRQRIDSFRTERQMSLLYSDIIDEVPGGKVLLSGYNPVHTGGPMQVSVAFAQEHVREKPYGAALARELGGDLRNAVFTRRGGVYFGIAHLLDYPAPYRDPIYRFADFNAGRYSSRNAAFQQALAQLSGKAMSLDGDLLKYDNGVPGAEASATQRSVLKLAGRLKLSPGEINAGLRQEKSESFVRTLVYQRLFALADAAAGRPLPRETLPRIGLKSPKIRSKITTAWFAGRVNTRYVGCLKRAATLREPPHLVPQ